MAGIDKIIQAVGLLWVTFCVSMPGFSQAKTPKAIPSRSSQWSITMDSVSQMDGTRTVEVVDKSVLAIADRDGQSVRPMLALRCEQQTFSTMFFTAVLPEWHGMEGAAYGGVSVRFKFDNEPPIEEAWLVTNNNRWLVTQTGYSKLVLDRLLKAKSLMVEFTRFGDGKEIARFNLDGLDIYVGKIRAACPNAGNETGEILSPEPLSTSSPGESTPVQTLPGAEKSNESKSDTVHEDVGPPPKLSIEAPMVLSDTWGVEFGPYLDRIIHIVRHNWLETIPESARLGEKGRVGVVFEILKDGSVPQSRMVASSGSDPLDRAAVNGIHASIPFPPLPQDFKGNHLVLQLTFLYNIAPK